MVLYVLFANSGRPIKTSSIRPISDIFKIKKYLQFEAKFHFGTSNTKLKKVIYQQTNENVINTLKFLIPIYINIFFFSELAHQRNHALIPPEKRTRTQWSISRLYFTFYNTSISSTISPSPIPQTLLNLLEFLSSNKPIFSRLQL